MIKKVIGGLFSAIIIIGILVGLARWQEAGTEGGPGGAVTRMVDIIANFVATSIPELIRFLGSVFS